MNEIIWYMHPYAGSPTLGMSYRPYYLAKAFNKRDTKTYIIGASFHHLLQSTISIDTPIQHQKVDDIDYIFIKTNTYKGNGLKRIINMFSYAFRFAIHYKRLIQITGKPDKIIVSSSHPLHFPVAKWLSKKLNCQLIFEVRDLWPLSLTELLGVSKYHPFVLLLSYIEKSAYKSADKVVSVLKNAFPYMQKKGLTRDKYIVIPNGIEITPLKPQPLPNDLQQIIINIKSKKQYLLIYAGAMGKPNALEQLIQAMTIIQAKGNTHIHALLVGDGVEKQNLIDEVAKNKVSNCTFFPRILKSQIPGLLSKADALFLGWQDKPIYQYGISPNKLYDYMLSGKPIIHATNTPDDPVSSAKAGIKTPAENALLLANAINEISQKNPNELVKLGEQGRKYVIKHYDYDYLAARYLKNLQQQL